MCDKKLKLQEILDEDHIDHEKLVLQEPTLKDVHIYCKIHKLSGQTTGLFIENYIRVKYDMKKNNPGLCSGDLKHNLKNIEIKASNGGKNHNEFNYVQLRLNHDCEYILTAYYINKKNIDNLGELFIFRLDKNSIRNLILKYGQYAHGTISKLGKITIEDLNNEKNDKEYAIRPKYGNKCWKDLLSFRINEITI